MTKRGNPWGKDWSPHQLKFHISLREVTASEKFTKTYYDNTMNQIVEGAKKYYNNMPANEPQKEENANKESNLKETTPKSQMKINDFFSKVYS